MRAGEAGVGHEIDTARVICTLAELPVGGCRGFKLGHGDWPLRGLVVRLADAVHAYVNRCPHAGHPLDLRPGRFLTPDGTLILCASHGALFERSTGRCVAGPCPGKSLRRVPVRVEANLVMLDESADVDALADSDG